MGWESSWRGCRTQRLLPLQKYLPHTVIVPAADVLADGLLEPIFVGAFEKLRKVTIRFVASVRPHGTTLFPLDGFS